jgi:hypothetical protein
MTKSTKKQAVKRKYVKKADKWTNKDTKRAIKNIELIDLKNPEAEFKQAIGEFKSAAPKKELDELEFLDCVVTGVEQMTNEQKSRFINYIYSRYWMYITLSKLTQ